MRPIEISLTLVLVAVTCLVSWLAWKSPPLMSRLILWPPAITRRGELHRLVSYGFLHADGMHLLFNMVTLYFFGGAVEKIYARAFGSFGFLAFYLGALLVSILPSYLQHRNDGSYRSLGASGAVSAVLFAFILVQPWAEIYVFFVPMPALLFAALFVGYSLWMERRGGDNVNHGAHLWGAGYGLVVGWLLIRTGG